MFILYVIYTGDMLYFHNYKHPEFSLDIVDDIRRLVFMYICFYSVYI